MTKISTLESWLDRFGYDENYKRGFAFILGMSPRVAFAGEDEDHGSEVTERLSAATMADAEVRFIDELDPYEEFSGDPDSDVENNNPFLPPLEASIEEWMAAFLRENYSETKAALNLLFVRWSFDRFFERALSEIDPDQPKPVPVDIEDHSDDDAHEAFLKEQIASSDDPAFEYENADVIWEYRALVNAREEREAKNEVGPPRLRSLAEAHQAITQAITSIGETGDQYWLTLADAHRDGVKYFSKEENVQGNSVTDDALMIFKALDPLSKTMFWAIRDFANELQGVEGLQGVQAANWYWSIEFPGLEEVIDWFTNILIVTGENTDLDAMDMDEFLTKCDRISKNFTVGLSKIGPEFDPATVSWVPTIDKDADQRNDMLAAMKARYDYPLLETKPEQITSKALAICTYACAVVRTEMSV